MWMHIRRTENLRLSLVALHTTPELASLHPPKKLMTSLTGLSLLHFHSKSLFLWNLNIFLSFFLFLNLAFYTLNGVTIYGESLSTSL